MEQAQPQPTTIYERILLRIQQRLSDRVRFPFAVRLWSGPAYRFGQGEPEVEILARDRVGLAALARMDELGICEAYMSGSLEVHGDFLRFISLREVLTDRHPLDLLWRRVLPLLIGRPSANRQAIATHYEIENDFFLEFLDSTRCYSQGVFERDDESLDSAQRRKLDYAIDACALKPGDRVLDVGCGWGSFVERAGQRGIQVTGLTISHQSEQFVSDLIARLGLPARVSYQDFLTFDAPELYDAIVILGVMEHLPDYSSALEQLQRLLRPGGRIYLDASAFREKYVKATFISRYVFPGDHSFFCLHDFLGAVARTQLDVLTVLNDRHNYYLTCKAWAENLDAARDRIIRRWGEPLYRRFRLYLWGSTYGFLTRGVEAFRLVLEKPHQS